MKEFKKRLKKYWIEFTAALGGVIMMLAALQEFLQSLGDKQ